MICAGSIPHRSDSEMRRLTASVWLAAQPPLFPIVANTSKSPSSSWLIVTYRAPQPVDILRVDPKVTSPRERGMRWHGASITGLPGTASRFTSSTWFSREPSRYTVTPLHPMA